MKAHITMKWNPNKGSETSIKLRSHFNDLQHIEKLDFLKDCRAYIDELYESLLKAGAS